MIDNKNHTFNESSSSGQHLTDLLAQTFNEQANTTLKNTSNLPSKRGYFDANLEHKFQKDRLIREASPESIPDTKEEESDKTKSSLRLRYEAEVKVIQKTLGNLESIRRELGLSKRKMAQLLLVDPSAWTRWTKDEASVPPHIYRALHWYMLLQDKAPELRSAFWLGSVAQPSIPAQELNRIKNEIKTQIQRELGSHSRAQAFSTEVSQKNPIRLYQGAIVLLVGLLFLSLFF